MSDALGTLLPDELVRAVLVWLDDNESETWERTFKRGLTPCSLTCRYWAKLIRPILFKYLTLESADDVSQLAAILGAHDFLGCPIGNCIVNLTLVENPTSSGIPWGHQLALRSYQQVPFAKVTWTIKGAPTDSQLQPSRKWPTLPPALLPRVLPASPIPLSRLALSNLHVSSARGLVNFVKGTQLNILELENVTFPGNPGHILRPRSSPQQQPRRIDFCELYIQRCIEKSTDLPFWIKLSNAIFTGQRRPPSDNDTEALVTKHLNLVASLHQCEDSMSLLWVGYMPYLNSGNYYYEYTLYKAGAEGAIAEVHIPAKSGANPRIVRVTFVCPDADGEYLSSLLHQLEAAFIDINGIDIPELLIKCDIRDSSRALVCDVLEGRILTQLRARQPKKVLIDVSLGNRATIENILSAPSCISHGDETISLSTVQRAEWLLRWEHERDAYLREQLHAAQAAKATANTSSETAPGATEGSEDDIAERAQGL
ncbi:uncharacterized protein PHACADRAFT_261514 [Phanerochaete carnosa HHB-10118-sp]|uniref:F-box domain-containing protein n=1 Tax=Phanerochaete carnosa (strain HHB-10118-sp) TaxID=650164 RepID=K5VN49_PHACS|nr:uncharacterized protein PHACADRAFT_261514 [Phanerochaete carnosa HHB-10118-sp]EKM52858.1 hypothetical protein PHACADRAFT_261514 [Phanerochaete carnosa HHB-10118-sp]